jgi:hypothetical protein
MKKLRFHTISFPTPKVCAATTDVPDVQVVRQAPALAHFCFSLVVLHSDGGFAFEKQAFSRWDPHFTLVVDKEENLSIGQAIPDSSSFAAEK